ncbi:MAG: hypothetical protein A3C46_00455 [Deltaproteobacteria bacterium RIFCSPHIGHO2_02_FULL_44_16]|nr:MAG: hypothetical protein A3C46_00455 [Deltaproteobacteria bacterium RIFCSPHIGHO2_02_FULL_44_16]
MTFAAIFFSLLFFVSSAHSMNKRVEPQKPLEQKLHLLLRSPGFLHPALLDAQKLLQQTAELRKEELLFLIGSVAYQQGNWVEAENIFFSLEEANLPLLQDYLFFYRARLLFQQGKWQEARNILHFLMQQEPDSVWNNEAKKLLAKIFFEQRLYQKSFFLLEEVRGKAKTISEFREINVLLFKNVTALGKWDDAKKILEALLVTSTNENELSAAHELFSLFPQKRAKLLEKWFPEPELQYRIVESFEEHGAWVEAKKRLVRFMETISSSKLKRRAQLLLAKCEARLHQYQRALELLESIEKESDDSELQDEILSQLVWTYAKNSQYEKADQFLQKILIRHKDAPVARRQTIYYRASLELVQGKYEDALRSLTNVLTLHPHGDLAMNTRWNRAWCLYKLGQYKEAIEVFDQLLGERNSISDRVRYWKGRVLEKLQKREEAILLYRELWEEKPVGYYRGLASHRLQALHKKIETPVMTASNVWQVHLPSPEEIASTSPHLAKALLFHRLGLREEVARELNAFREYHPKLDPLVLFLASENFAHNYAYRIASDRFRSIRERFPNGDPFEIYVWQQMYPQAYRSFVLEALQKSDLDPALVYSVMWAESLFRPDALSDVGAIGLLQLMPTTAEKLEPQETEEVFNRELLYKPSANIYYGVRYLEKLAKMFPEKPVAWIAAYNAGEEAVSRWLKRSERQKNFEVEEFIEEIPYRETNLYVKKVFSAYWMHQSLYSSHKNFEFD